MRLTPDEASAISSAARDVFGPAAVVRLFGSRVDDAKRGGDIDLIVEVPEGRERFEDECAFARAIEDRIGERRVDVLLVSPGRPLQPIEKIAYRDGVVLEGAPGGPTAAPPARAYGWDWGLLVTEDQAKLAATVEAGRRLSASLWASLDDMAAHAPLTAGRVDALDRAAQKDVLAFLKAFEQLQDLTSNRLIRSVLVVSGSEVARMSAIDAYNEAEKFGALEDARRFLEIARLRNRLVHEYPMDAAARAKRVNDAYALAPALLDEFDRLAAYAARLTDQGETS